MPARRSGKKHVDSDTELWFRGGRYRSRRTFQCGTHRAEAPAETLKRIKPYLDRAGISRVADITGLDKVGVPTTLAIRPNAITMACSSGKGLTLDQAYASGAMEAFELYAAETAAPPTTRASYNELLRDYTLPEIGDLPLSRWTLFSPDWPFHWFVGWDLISQSEVAVPLSTVVMSREFMLSSAGAFHVSSNGLGAGNTFLEAVAAGLYEVIERDAIACSFHAALHKGRSIPILTEAVSRSYAQVSGVLDLCDRAGVRVVLYDCTVNTDVPTYNCLVLDRLYQGVGVVRGSGTHLDPEVAILRAITEALQGRLNFIAGSRDDIFRAAFGRMRTDWDSMAKAIEAEQAASIPASVRASTASETFEDDILELIRHVQAAGAKHIVVADLTPQDFPVHIVRVIVPGFEGYMHHGYRPGRRATSFACVMEKT